MKISKFIEELEKLKERYGDLPVCTRDREGYLVHAEPTQDYASTHQNNILDYGEQFVEVWEE